MKNKSFQIIIEANPKSGLRKKFAPTTKVRPSKKLYKREKKVDY